MNGRPPSRKEDGMVLVIVLWLITCIALLVASFNATVNSGTLAIGNEIMAIRAIPLLDAGVELAAHHLNAKDKENKWIADGREYREQIAGKWISLRIYDENGKIDLNKAKPELMTSLIKHYAKTSLEAQDITMAIMKLRKARTGTEAAKDVQVSNKTKAAPPRKSLLQAFVHVSQLLQVPGVTYALYRKLLPFITVYNPRGIVNMKTAARDVMLALPGMTPIEVDNRLAMRDEPAAYDGFNSTPAESSKSTGSGRAGPAYTVIVRKDGARGGEAVETAATILTGAMQIAPFHILAWQSNIR